MLSGYLQYALLSCCCCVGKIVTNLFVIADEVGKHLKQDGEEGLDPMIECLLYLLYAEAS